MRLALFLCFFLALSFAEEPTPFDIASFRSDLLIGGIVNPLNGQVSLRQTDLLAKGAQPITLQRIFIPYGLPLLLGLDPILDYVLAPASAQALSQGGWHTFPHQYLHIQKDKIYFNDPSGNSYCFKNGKTESSLGMSNVSQEEPSGRFDPRNIRISLKRNKVIVQAPDGTRRHYTLVKEKTYILEKEILPHGKVIRYRKNLIDSTDLV